MKENTQEIECSVCGYRADRFRPAGLAKRPNAICPDCGAFERHRLVAWHLRRIGGLRSGMRILEVAPTPCLQALARKEGAEIVSIDLENRPDAEQMDVEKMKFSDDSFDAIFCIHVLEHVASDRRALSELQRVLRPNGWAVLMVPIRAGAVKTDEDPSVTDPVERERRFGQRDHVRYYGGDYVNRCENAGFRMETIQPADPALMTRHAFLAGETLYLGWKDAKQ